MSLSLLSSTSPKLGSLIFLSFIVAEVILGTLRCCCCALSLLGVKFKTVSAANILNLCSDTPSLTIFSLRGRVLLFTFRSDWVDFLFSRIACEFRMRKCLCVILDVSLLLSVDGGVAHLQHPTTFLLSACVYDVCSEICAFCFYSVHFLCNICRLST